MKNTKNYINGKGIFFLLKEKVENIIIIKYYQIKNIQIKNVE